MPGTVLDAGSVSYHVKVIVYALSQIINYIPVSSSFYIKKRPQVTTLRKCVCKISKE